MQGLKQSTAQPDDEQELFKQRPPGPMVAGAEDEAYTIDGVTPKTYAVLPRDQIYAAFKAIHPFGGRVAQWATLAHLEQKNFAAAQRAKAEAEAALQASAPPTPSVPNDSDEVEFKPVKGKVGLVAQYAKAKAETVINGKISDEDAAIRLSLCRHGGVRCAKCGALAALDRESMEWRCDSESHPNAKGCDWSMSHEDAVEKQSPPCPGYRMTDKGEFCGRCGCGQRADAELKTKTKMRLATCPRKAKHAIWPEIKED